MSNDLFLRTVAFNRTPNIHFFMNNCKKTTSARLTILYW